MKNKIKQKDGFTLLITIIGLALMTTLGFAILTSTTNNFKATNLDSRNQSTFYVAEAGINYSVDHLQTIVKRTDNSNKKNFFSNINKEIEKPITLYLDKNFGEIPTAQITITSYIKDADSTEYIIESVGRIGKSVRTLTSVISVKLTEPIASLPSFDPNIAVNTNSFSYTGGQIKAKDQTIIFDSNNASKLHGGVEVEAKNIYFKSGNIELKGKEYGNDIKNGNIYFEGDAISTRGQSNLNGTVYVKGNFTAKGGLKVNGDLYVNGDLILSGTSSVKGNVYVMGTAYLATAKVEGNVFVFNNKNVAPAINSLSDSSISGDLYVEGNANLPGAHILGTSKILGSLTLTDSTNLGNGSEGVFLYHSGKFVNKEKVKNSLTNKIQFQKEIEKIVAPKIDFQTPPLCKVNLKSDAWFDGKLYTKGKSIETNKIIKNSKWLVDSFKLTNWQDEVDNTVIVSKGDITLGGMSQFEGVLISSEGEIIINSGGQFKGVLISNKGISIVGDMKVGFKLLKDYFSTEEDFPVTFLCGEDESPQNGSPGNGNIITKNDVQFDVVKQTTEK